MVTLRSGTLQDASVETKQDSNASSEKYEDYRKRRIQENMQKMHEMGITNLSIGAPATKSPRRTPSKASHVSPISQNSLPSRRSSRYVQKPEWFCRHMVFCCFPLWSFLLRREGRLGLPLLCWRRQSYIPSSANRLQKISPVNYSEIHPPMEKKSKGEQILIGEGLVPEVYTEEHEKLLGSCQNVWVLFQDGYGRDGKRIYDPFDGKTCHQCRYGENVLEVNRTPGWICPVCRGICNCSFCRIKKGWLPTGPLYKKITRLGYKSVAHYLIQTRQIDAKNKGDDEKVDESTPEGPLNSSDADQADMQSKLSSAMSESCQDPEDLIGQQKEPSDVEAQADKNSPAATVGLINQQHEASMTSITDTDHHREKKYASDLISPDNSGPHQNPIVESLHSGREIAGVVNCNLNSSTKGLTEEVEVNALDAFSPTTPENVRKPKEICKRNDSECTVMISDSIAGRIKRRRVQIQSFNRLVVLLTV
ncbi:Cell division cycle-associated 7-like protein [Nymphaea thermarum]|nr:Cell division cycle-associated 7-like protein [Nymphaea thermarum]